MESEGELGCLAAARRLPTRQRRGRAYPRPRAWHLCPHLQHPWSLPAGDVRDPRRGVTRGERRGGRGRLPRPPRQPRDPPGRGRGYARRMARARGSYVLVLRVRAPLRLQVGRLGKFLFAPGAYAYVGSAKGGFHVRLRHHLQATLRPRWHIDYLRQRSEPAGIWVAPDERLEECELARAVAALPGAAPGPRGFGSSDCRCPTHLYRLPSERMLAELGLTVWRGSDANRPRLGGTRAGRRRSEHVGVPVHQPRHR